MVALRCAARRLLGGQPQQPIYGAAVAGEQRRLLPRIIHGGSSACSRRFISNQPSEPERMTFEEKWRLSKRVAHVLFRLTNAVLIMVASGMIIKLSANELFGSGYLSEFLRQDKQRGLGDNPEETNIEYMLKDGSTLEAKQVELESVMAEFESALKNATQRVQKQRFAPHEDHGPYTSFN